MKKFIKLLLPIICLSILACDADDENNNLPDEIDQTDDMDNTTDDTADQTAPLSFFSLTPSDQWNYETTTDTNEITQDTLSVVGDIILDNILFKDLEVNMGNGGFMTALFNAGAIKEENAILEYTGSLSFPLDDLNTIDIEIPSLKLYNENSIQGVLIDQVEQIVEQEIDGTPITIMTIASSYSGGLEQDISVNGIPFESVIKSDLVINTTITATILGATVTVLEPQDILVVENTYAENIGLVSSSLNFNYEFIDLSPFGIALPFPQTGSGSSEQLIVTYEVAGDD